MAKRELMKLPPDVRANLSTLPRTPPQPKDEQSPEAKVREATKRKAR